LDKERLPESESNGAPEMALSHYSQLLLPFIDLGHSQGTRRIISNASTEDF
jgi:hypothetical protein